MADTKPYKCVNCGEAAAALFRNYGPSVLKLTKCEECKGVVDKYIEYDPVIVMIDLVLMSREAQRHVIYNIEFKSYWKLLIILIMLETYGVWRSDSLFNIAINTMCGIQTNNTVNMTHLSLPINLSESELLRNSCLAWTHEEKTEDNDLFIWEKDFYIQFTSTFLGIVMFILTVQSLMKLVKPVTSQRERCLSSIIDEAVESVLAGQREHPVHAAHAGVGQRRDLAGHENHTLHTRVPLQLRYVRQCVYSIIQMPSSGHSANIGSK
ncbi:hypothetical protein O3G_MSEX005161 [Manduca sexta]|uniref:Protein ARV n=1 Tax=Manduca sexta TaxID=7130 RepID=A0A921YXU9_MANSE|nr:hypothetical protein O3G_MSEX005161 [Manduca sexta]